MIARFFGNGGYHDIDGLLYYFSDSRVSYLLKIRKKIC